MKYQCEVCGHINGHAYNCPEAPKPKPLYHCEECGLEIFVGDTAYKVSGLTGEKWYCCECCAKYEVETIEGLDDDY